ncbi:MAG: MFS transporter, partial [Firmicutes bacterium]|nr:MFS transporter [Bacillota bacterium]
EVGLLTSVYAVSTMAVRFLVSVRLALPAVPRVMRAGFALLVAAVGMVAASPGLGWLAAGIILAGAANALIMPHLLSLAGGLAPPGRREAVLSYYSLALSLSLVLAPVFGTLILTVASIRAVYGLLVAFAAVAAVLMFRSERALSATLAARHPGAADGRVTQPLWPTLRALWHHPYYRADFAGFLLFNLSFTAAMAFGGVDVKSRFHLPYSGVEMVLTSFFVASLLGRVVIARRTRRGGLARKLDWMLASLAVGGAGLVLMGWAPSLAVFLAGFWLLAWPHAVLFPLMSMRIAGYVEPAQLVAANTLLQSSFDIAGIAGPLIVGLMAVRTGIGPGFWAIAVLQGVAMGLLWPSRRRETAA